MRLVTRLILLTGLAAAGLPALSQETAPADDAALSPAAPAAADAADAFELPAAPAQPAPPAPPVNELISRSGDFWGDWNETKTSEEFVALKAAVGGVDKTMEAIGAATANTQVIVNVAVDKAEDAAALMSKTADASADAESAAAVSTVLTMVTSPATREAAIAYVEPQAQARVEQWNADLSSGIQGLPGIYLNTEVRSSAPPSYAPVSGGSSGCTSR